MSSQAKIEDAVVEMVKTFACERRRFELMCKGLSGNGENTVVWSDNLTQMAKSRCRKKADEPQYHRIKRIRPGQKKKRKPVDPFWVKLARSVLESRHEPAYFVRIQFEYLKPFADPPNQYFLQSTDAFERAKVGHMKLVQLYQDLFLAMNSKLQTNLSYYRSILSDATPGQIVHVVLSRDDLEIDALIRHSMAMSMVDQYPTMQKIVDRFETSAAIQYHRFPRVYDSVCGEDFISPRLRENAKRIYEQVFTGG